MDLSSTSAVADPAKRFDQLPPHLAERLLPRDGQAAGTTAPRCRRSGAGIVVAPSSHVSDWTSRRPTFLAIQEAPDRRVITEFSVLRDTRGNGWGARARA